MSTDNHETFSLLNLAKVQGVAQKIMDSFPKLHFTQVKIYKNSPKLSAYLEHYKKYYALVFEVIDYDCYTQQYEDLKDCLRPPYEMKLASLIGNDLAGTYRHTPSPEFNFWDEWDFHLTTTNRRDVINDQCTPTDSFLDQAENFDFVILAENHGLVNINDLNRLDDALTELAEKISTLGYSLEKADSLDVADEMRLRKIEYENKLHTFLDNNSDLNNFSRKNLSGKPAQAAFIEKEMFFEIFFNGKKIHIKKSKGALSLHYLIERKGKYVPKTDIDIHLNPAPPADQKYSDPQSNISSSIHSEQSARTDIRPLEGYKSRLNDLEEELEKAELNHDQGKIAKLKSDKEALIREIKAAYHKESPNYVKNIGKAIKRTISDIKQDHKELSEHLDRYIITPNGKDTCYSPNPDINWRTE